jgi:hypothetical protein
VSETVLVIRDFLSRRVLGEIPWTGLRYETRMNGAGRLTTVVPAYEGGAAEILLPGRMLVGVLLDGSPIWSGVLWKRSIAANAQIAIQADEILSYWDRRRIRDDLGFTQIDQAAILATLIDFPQRTESGSLGVEMTGPTTTGVLRDRYYLAQERKIYGEMIRQLLGVIDGCDLVSDPVVRNGTWVDRFRLAYPRLGRPVSESRIVFQVGENCTVESWDEDAYSSATRVDAVGAAGIGSNVPIVNTQWAPALHGAGWPVLDETLVYTDVSEAPTLAQKAKADLSARAGAVLSVKVVVTAESDPAPGTYGPGDDCRLIVPAGPVFSAGIDTVLRIGSVEIDAGQQDLARVTLLPQIVSGTELVPT